MNNLSIKLLIVIIAFLFIGTANLFAQWTLDFDFDSGTMGQQVTEFSDASGDTYYNNSIVYDGVNSAQLNIQQGTDGWAFWGGRKELPTYLSEDDEVWVRVRTFMPLDFDYSTNFALKFLRLRVMSAQSEHIGYVDIYINNDGTYRYQNEQYTTKRFKFSSLNGVYQVGETVTGSNSGATAIITAIKPATADNPTHVVFKYTGTIEFQRWENVVGQISGTIGYLNIIDTNSVTVFGSENPIRKGVWETYVYHIRHSTTNPLIQFYKHTGESGFTIDGKPIGGSLKLLFEDKTDFTLATSSSQVTHFLLFTYWNGNAPQTQSMYVDDLWISTEPPPEIISSSARYNLAISTIGNGIVTSSEVGNIYNIGTTVTLTATSNPGWQFDGWSGDLSGNSNPTIITMDGNKTVIATFTEIMSIVNPQEPIDTDSDGISDIDEIKWGLDPLDASDGGNTDTDGDGVNNADEIEAGSNPFDPNDTKKPKRFIPIMMDDIMVMVPA